MKNCLSPFVGHLLSSGLAMGLSSPIPCICFCFVPDLRRFCILYISPTWAPILLRLCHHDKLSFKTRVPDKFLIPGIFRTHSSGSFPSYSSLQREQNHYHHQLNAPYQSWVSGHCYTTCSAPNIFDSCNRRRSWTELGKLRESHYICGKWSLCNASIARLVFDAIKIRMTTRSICLVSRTVFSYRRYVRFKQMLVHHVFHFLRHEQEQPGMRQV